MGVFKVKYLISMPLLALLFVTSCKSRFINSYNQAFRIQCILQENHCIVIISAFEDIFYERHGGNNYLLIIQGGVCYQSDIPDLLRDSIASSPPKDFITSDIIIKQLSKGKQDTLYNIDLCGLETYNQFDPKSEFNVQVEQVLYLARRDKKMGREIWHTAKSPTMVLNCK